MKAKQKPILSLNPEIGQFRDKKHQWGQKIYSNLH
jgi:hypothetical protein